MDGFSYHNIFDTKGIEYLVIIAFLLLLIPFWLALNKQVKIREKISKALGVLSTAVLKIPQGLFYSKNHTWAYLEKSGTAKIGVDDLLVHITGEVNIHPLKNPGESIKKGDLVAEMDQGGKSLSVFSPVSGTIINSNQALKENNELLSLDPYGEGWIYTIKPTNWQAEMPACVMAEEASEWFTKELNHYKDFLAIHMMKYSPEAATVVMQDGGELSDNSLSELPDEIWQDFQKEFLNP